MGFMFIHCSEGAEEAILEKVRAVPGVAYGYKLDGVYDLVIKLESQSVEQFTLAIATIRKTSQILNTDTMVGFK